MPPLPETEMSNALPKASSTKKPIPTPKELLSDQIRIDDKVYNAKELARTHPGGELFVRAFAGRDATEAFLSYHRRQFPHESKNVTSAYLGETTSVKSANADKDYLELCEIVDKGSVNKFCAKINIDQ